MLRNITLSADENLIHRAREKARTQNETLNAAFRKWLIDYTEKKIKTSNYLNIMHQLQYVDSGKNFSRDELNER